MNPAVRDKWVAALRSGKYIQGRRRLTTIDPKGNEADCCLGVLCKLAIEDGVKLDVADVHDEGDYKQRWYGGRFDLPPHAVLMWAGLPTHGNPTVVRHLEGRKETVALATLNDNGYSFAQIADLIEAQL